MQTHVVVQTIGERGLLRDSGAGGGRGGCRNFAYASLHPILPAHFFQAKMRKRKKSVSTRKARGATVEAKGGGRETNECNRPKCRIEKLSQLI